MKGRRISASRTLTLIEETSVESGNGLERGPSDGRTPTPSESVTGDYKREIRAMT